MKSLKFTLYLFFISLITMGFENSNNNIYYENIQLKDNDIELENFIQEDNSEINCRVLAKNVFVDSINHNFDVFTAINISHSVFQSCMRVNNGLN